MTQWCMPYTYLYAISHMQRILQWLKRRMQIDTYIFIDYWDTDVFGFSDGLPSYMYVADSLYNIYYHKGR